MPPDRWKKMSTAKRQKTARIQLFSRLGDEMQMAASTVRNDYLCLLSLLAEQDPGMYARSLSLDADQMNLLIQDPELTKKIIKDIEDERKKAEKELKKRQKEEADAEKAKRKEEKEKIKKQNDESIPDIVQPEEEKKQEKPKSQSTLFSFGG